MSRLRRMVLADRFFFVTCRLLPRRTRLAAGEFEDLARVIRERRDEHRFLLTAWVLLPDHWHAIFFPRHPLTISRVLEAIKVGSTLRINAGRKERGLLWQRRFFDRALRTVKEYGETVGYIHHNPVKAGAWSGGRRIGRGRVRGNSREPSGKMPPATPSFPSTACCGPAMNEPESDQVPQSLWDARLCATLLRVGTQSEEPT